MKKLSQDKAIRLGLWREQATAAIKQGQSCAQFVAHCHPDNREIARRAYRRTMNHIAIHGAASAMAVPKTDSQILP